MMDMSLTLSAPTERNFQEQHNSFWNRMLLIVHSGYFLFI